ncbi:uncharacterized protein VP01_5282g1 [Puccinia sorghi]|uniref:Uncharacterized protein n=1 Tax=Puccinia sorghi TaxID=27349 RepID=A0A0L6UKB4_9BASI|nr:uncharacterized protein VP01_5282g1 [Puccinia sorghi]
MPQILPLFICFFHYCSRPILTCSPDFLSQAIHDKNSSKGPLPPPSVQPTPSFQELAMSDQSTGQPAPLKPESSILNSEIEKLTPEEFKQDTIAAEKETASMQQRLRLPKDLRQSLQQFPSEIINTKKSECEFSFI